MKNRTVSDADLALLLGREDRLRILRRLVAKTAELWDVMRELERLYDVELTQQTIIDALGELPANYEGDARDITHEHAAIFQGELGLPDPKRKVT